VDVIQTKSSAKRGQNDPGGVVIVAMTELVAGSMRDRMPEGSVISQTLPAPMVIPPSESAGPTGMTA